MNHAHNCPHCESLKDPMERLHDLHQCFAAIHELVTAGGRDNLSVAGAGNLSMLLGVLTDLNRSAVIANLDAFAKLEEENAALRRLAKWPKPNEGASAHDKSGWKRGAEEGRP